MLDNILIKRRGERCKSKNTTFFKFFELFCVFLCSAPRFSIIIKEKRLRNNEQFFANVSRETFAIHLHYTRGVKHTMGKTIVVANQKGGVAKTTTSVNLSACLAQYKKKVLLIDLDPQGNASSGLGVNKNELEYSSYDVLVNSVPIEKITVPINKNLDLLPAKVELAGAEMELVAAISREMRLKNALEEVAAQYDYVIIDTPPSLGLLTLNALTAADSFLVPIQCEYYALEGLSQLLSTIKLVQKNLNPNLQMEGILLTMYDNRTNLSNQVVADVRENFKEKVFKTMIPRNVRLSEAPSFGQSILDYDRKSKGAETYLALAKEVMKHG